MLKRCISFALLLVASCQSPTLTTANREYYARVEEMKTEDVYNVFVKEINGRVIGQYAFTNAHVILGKRGHDTIEVIKKLGVRGDAYFYDILFESLSIYSHINICDDVDFKKIKKQFIGDANKFIDCSRYQKLKTLAYAPRDSNLTPIFRE